MTFSAPHCCVLHRIASQVVSEWYQEVTANTFEVTIPNERSFCNFGLFRVRGDASSVDRYLHWIATKGGYATKGWTKCWAKLPTLALCFPSVVARVAATARRERVA